MSKTSIPKNYHDLLGLYDTQRAIGIIKTIFQEKLCAALHLKRVTAPLFVLNGSGLNDDLNGVERPVSFDVPCLDERAEVVHSLAKWKRYALAEYGFRPGQGLVTDMNAIRRDEELDNREGPHPALFAGNRARYCGCRLLHCGRAALEVPGAESHPPDP